MAEWSQSKVYDAWLECENDAWVRFSEIIAIEVEPAARTAGYVIQFATQHKRYIYRTLDERSQARGTVTELLHNIAHDWRQSA